MSFSRHNIEKRQLIELVRKNPILWDCRLPHYKRSDKKKAVKWNELGSAFNVSGERVQRTFTSLREIFRRELNQEKQLGACFTSKFEFYKDMAFLKGVIRERKSRDRLRNHQQQQENRVTTEGTEEQTVMDEYQFFAPNDPNNPSNVSQQQTATQNIVSLALLSPSVESANWLCKTAALAKNPPPAQPLLQPQLQPQANNGISLSEISSRSTSPSIYIKSEIESQYESDEEFDGIQPKNGNFLTLARSHNGFDKTVTKNVNKNDKNAQKSSISVDIDVANETTYDRPEALLIDSSNSTPIVSQTQTTAREILHKSFGDFLTARLNTLNEIVADDLINRILMLITEKATV